MARIRLSVVEHVYTAHKKSSAQQELNALVQNTYSAEMLASLGYQRLLMLFGVTVAHDLLLESLIAESSPCLRARWAFLYPGAWALVGSLAYFKGHGLPHSRVLVEGAVEVSVTGAVGLFSSVISLVSLLFIDYPTWIVVTGAVPAALAAFPGRTRSFSPGHGRASPRSSACFG